MMVSGSFSVVFSFWVTLLPLSPAEIEEKFDLGYHTKHVDTIFARVFG